MELKTMDLDTPVHTYQNEKGEKVFEFQIPPVTPEVPPIDELHGNLASSLTTDGERMEPSKFDSSTRPLFRVTPGPPTSAAPDSSLVDSIIKSIPMMGTRSRTWICKACGKYFKKRTELLTHVNVHLGFRPFQCTSCPKSFFHKSSLASHIRNNCLTAVLGPPTDLPQSDNEKDCDE